MTATSAATRPTSHAHRDVQPLAGAQAPRCVLRLRSVDASWSEIPRSSAMAPSSSAPAIAWFQNGETPRTYSADRIELQEQRAERRADDAPAAAEDGHAADDDRRDHLQLVAAAGRRVDRAVARRVEHAREAGDAAADHERGAHAPAARDAGEPRGVRVRPDRVQVATGAERAQVVGGDRDHERR